ERFVAARRTLERQWGCHNLELPLSRLCRSDSFARFALHLLANLERFHHIYNDVLRRHRQEHRIRSKNHPVPDLAEADGWRELPFWAWRTGRRARLFARRLGPRLQLRYGAETLPDLPAPDDPAALTAWRELQEAGYKIRSRALTT